MVAVAPYKKIGKGQLRGLWGILMQAVAEDFFILKFDRFEIIHFHTVHVFLSNAQGLLKWVDLFKQPLPSEGTIPSNPTISATLGISSFRRKPEYRMIVNH